MMVKLTDDGDIAAETALCEGHDTTANRKELVARALPDATGEWTDCTGNDELKCQVCGATDDVR